MRSKWIRIWALLLIVILAFPSGLGTVFAQTERKADIVFVIDTTGSMGGVISNVKNNVTQFVAETAKAH
ncbi:hypothetical protein, partial [Gorillibacterium massiliense]|uniref:hypothetical protein n=1 Tax=Gorillibacterium massiliense TaxID=1280390 RepID=UPI000594E3D8